MLVLRLFILNLSIVCLVFVQTAFSQEIGALADPPKPKPTSVRKPRPAPVHRPTKTTKPVTKPSTNPEDTPAKTNQRFALTITTDPPECEVYVNDSYRGTTAANNGRLVVPELAADTSYALRIYKRGLNEELQNIELDADKDVNFTLKAPVATNTTPDKPENNPPTEPVKTDPAKIPTEAIKPPQSEMVFIPTGEFVMGSDPSKFPKKVNLAPSELPAHKVDIPGFYIDVYEVTNGEYKLFCDATHHAYPKNPDWDNNYFLGKPQHPVIYVSWYDAQAYAQWVGKRLPTEEEWEKAARGKDGSLWPWGNEFQTGFANLADSDDVRYTAPVGSFRKGVSVYGVQDMVGNVWEWTDSRYKPYPNHKDKNTVYDQEKRVLRGGGWLSPINDLHSVAFRYPADPNESYPGTGFRCARSNASSLPNTK